MNRLVPTLLLASGCGGVGKGEPADACSGGWAVVGSMRTPTGYWAGAPLEDGRILALGFEHNEIFDPLTGTSESVEEAAVGGALALPDGRTLVIRDGTGTPQHARCGFWDASGYSPFDCPTAWSSPFPNTSLELLDDGDVLYLPTFGAPARLDPQTEIWTDVAGLPEPHLHQFYTSAPLTDGRILILDDGNWFRIYDSSTNAISERTLTESRFYDLTALSNGQVLARRWEETTETWIVSEGPGGLVTTPGPDLRVARQTPRTLRTSDGRVWVAGGTTGDDAVGEVEVLDIDASAFREAGTACVPRSDPLLVEVDGEIYSLGGHLGVGLGMSSHPDTPASAVVERWVGG